MTRIGANPAANPVASPAEPTAVESTANGDTTTQRRKRTVKPKHPSLDGDAKLKAVPDDYSGANHASLQETDFEPGSVHCFFDWKAGKLEKQASKLRKQAEAFRRTGSFVDTKTAKKVVEMQLEMAKLIAQLAAQGEDVSQFQTPIATPAA